MRKILITLFFVAACTDASNISIEIPFALFASDEISSSSTGVCTVAPVTQSGGLYKESGLLELNPVLNPNAEYVLNLQVENYLSQEVLQDSQGNTLVGENENDFQMEKATITYIDIEQQLTGPASDVALISGVVRTGGTQGATAVSIPAVGLNETLPWLNSFLTNSNLGPNATEDVVLQVQIFGVLSSGEQASSGIFHFPIQVCFGCKNVPLIAVANDAGVLYDPDCENGTTATADGHGPCCAPQDFAVFCDPCGGAGGACCGGPVGGSCSGTNTCTGTAPSGVEICDDLIPEYLELASTCATST